MIFSGTCYCGTPFVSTQRRRRFCSTACQNKARLKQMREREKANPEDVRRRREQLAQPRSCRHCSRSFTAKQAKQVFCTVPCEREHSRARGQAEAEQRQREREQSRRCKRCRGSMAGRHYNAVYCADCTRKAQRGKLRTATATARGKGVKSESWAKQPTNLKPRAPTRKTAAKKGNETKKPKGVDANLDGDWFPGWDGPWSPSIPPEGRVLIEKYFGPTPYPKKDEEVA